MPVVCGERGGYVDYVTHGHDALVVASTKEALESIHGLRRDPVRARALGLNAAQSAARLRRELEDRTVALLAPPPLSSCILPARSGTAFPTHAR